MIDMIEYIVLYLLLGFLCARTTMRNTYKRLADGEKALYREEVKNSIKMNLIYIILFPVFLLLSTYESFGD